MRAQEKLDFIKSKGLSFGCLSQGHLSKSCPQKLTCQICSPKHPTILHIGNKKVTQTAGESKKNSKISDENLSFTTDTETCGCTGAGEAECVLSIVPVKVQICEGELKS